MQPIEDDYYGKLYNRLYDIGYNRKPRARKTVEWVVRKGNPGLSVLDVGCGRGVCLDVLGEKGFGRVMGVDPSGTAVGHALKCGGAAVVGSAVSLPFPDKSFDVVMHAHVFEHLRPEDVPTAIHECWRVAKRFIVCEIATRLDGSGPRLVGRPLHESIHSTKEWIAMFLGEGRGKIIHRDGLLFVIRVQD